MYFLNSRLSESNQSWQFRRFYESNDNLETFTYRREYLGLPVDNNFFFNLIGSFRQRLLELGELLDMFAFVGVVSVLKGRRSSCSLKRHSGKRAKFAIRFNRKRGHEDEN